MASFAEMAGVTPPGQEKQESQTSSFADMAGITPPETPGKTVIGTTAGTGNMQRAIDYLSETVSKPILNVLINSGLSAADAVNTMVVSMQKNLQEPGKQLPMIKGMPQAQAPEINISPALQQARQGYQQVGLLEPGIATTVGQAVGGAAPYFAAPELAPESIASQAAVGAGMGALENPDDKFLGAATGAVGTGGAELAAKGGTKAYDVIKNALNKGMAKEVQPVIKGRIGEILTDLKGGSSKATSNDDVFSNVERYYEELKGETPEGTELFNKYVTPGQSVGDAYAKLNGIDVKDLDKTAFHGAIDKHIANLNKSIQLLGDQSSLAKPYLEMRNVLTDLKAANIKSFKDVDSVKKLVNHQIGSIPYNSELSPLRSILHDVKDGLHQSLHDSSTEEGSNLLKEADSAFKEKIVPFKKLFNKDSPFNKRYNGSQSTDNFVNDYLKPGAQKDQSERLDNFLKMIPDDETRKLAAYDFLKQSDTDAGADAQTFIKKYATLGEKQKAALLPEYKEELDNLSNLFKKYPNAFKESAQEGLSSKITGGLVNTASAAGAIGSMYAHSPIGLALSASPFIAKGALKALASKPGMQEKFIQQAAKGSESKILKPLLESIGRKLPPTLATYYQQRKRGE